jgi:hypothetical protein
MTKWLSLLSIALVALTFTVRAFSDDQQKAEKQLHKITALATDATGRRVVSITVADTLGTRRPALVMQRRALNLNYGDLFVAHVLLKNGAKMEDIAAQLKARKNIGQIANEQHADWKQIAADAKKLNSKVEDNLYKHFINSKAYFDRDQADKYDPTFDGVTADNDVSKGDIAEAEHTYQLWHDRAKQNLGGTLGIGTENAFRGFRGDPIEKAPETDAMKTASPH